MEAINDVITYRRLDVLVLTETWHLSVNDMRLRLATPVDCAVVNTPHCSGRGAGITVIYRRQIKCSQMQLPLLTTFKAICICMTTASCPIILLNIYHSDRSIAMK